MSMGFVILAVLVVAIVAVALWGFSALAELLGIMLDACDPD